MGQIICSIQKIITKILFFLIKTYQLVISPVLGTHCRFYPSCSHYALSAIEQHGPLKGGWYAICRLSRCHPFTTGGYDPVSSITSNRRE